MKHIKKYILEKFQITKDSKYVSPINLDIEGNVDYTKKEIEEIIDLAMQLPKEVVRITNKERVIMTGDQYYISQNKLWMYFQNDNKKLLFGSIVKSKLATRYNNIVYDVQLNENFRPLGSRINLRDIPTAFERLTEILNKYLGQ